jgi:hypothetical protein
MKIHSNYKKKIKKKILLQNILILLCLLGLAYFLFTIFKPEITTYAVKDSCGPIGNTISHSIDDQESCQNACNSVCKSFGLNFHKSEFLYMKEVTCNNCTCLCKR